jgi:hypothetical protein
LNNRGAISVTRCGRSSGGFGGKAGPVTSHRCDPHAYAPPERQRPLTTSRVLRLLLAHLDTDDDSTESMSLVLQEVYECPYRLQAMLMMTSGLITQLIARAGWPTVIAAELDRQLAVALDQLAKT